MKQAYIKAREELDQFAQEDGLHVAPERGSSPDGPSEWSAEQVSSPEGPSEGPSEGPLETDPQPELDSAADVPMSNRSIVRKLFNKIALRTHPDKVKDPKLTKLFLRAKRANLVELCLILFKVDYSSYLALSDSDLDLISEEIKQQETMNNDHSLGLLWSTFSAEQKKNYYTMHIKTKLEKLFKK